MTRAPRPLAFRKALQRAIGPWPIVGEVDLGAKYARVTLSYCVDGCRLDDGRIERLPRTTELVGLVDELDALLVAVRTAARRAQEERRLRAHYLSRRVVEALAA